ncbi:MAG: adenylate/guanylate cyclase domain-containing protein, partial [Chloroflexota bacterium]
EQALQLVTELEPDLILLDINLPKIDGFQVCRRLRADKRTAYIPIIIMTAVKTSFEDKLTGLGLGADDYLIKPFRMKELILRIERKLELRSESKKREVLTQTILSAGATELVSINPGLFITEFDPGLPDLLNIPKEHLLNKSLLDTFPELIGYEDVLGQLCKRQIPRCYLPMINRSRAIGHDDLYIDLTLQPDPDLQKTGWLLMLVTDVTEQANLRRKVAQQRNELKLLSSQLTQLNHKLDYILRRYVPSEVVDAITSGQMSDEPGGQLRDVTILFADMRGYTKIARTLSTDQVMPFLNKHLHLASEAIAQTDGTIAQYMGDAIMAVFNGIFDQPDHAWRAVQAGFYIQEALAAHYAQTKDEHEIPPVGFGVGIFTGPALVGNTGSDWQFAFSAIGNTTNMSYRLTMLAGPGEIYIGEDTYQTIRDKVEVTSVPPLEIKGINKPVPAYQVTGLIG